MSSEKGTLVKNVDDPKFISEIIDNKISIKENYIWNMLGTISSSLISVILLLLASRLLDSQNSDIFSIAYALSQQFFILGYFQIRNMQSTDVQERHSFVSYHNTRIVTVIMMLLTSLGYIFVQGYSFYKAVIILLLVFLTVVLDYRISTRNFEINFYPSIFKDNRNIISILKEAFPLFLNGFLITYVYNEAKIDIDSLLSQGLFSNGIQRDFNVLFMPVFVLSLLFFVLRPLTTQLSIYWYEQKYNLFYKQVYLLFATMTVLGIIIIGLGYLIGTEILGFIYGTSLVEYKVPFVILLIGGILNVLALVIDIVMTIFRKQTYLVIAYITSFIVAKFITMPFVKGEGIMGASMSFLISMIIFFCTSIIIYIWVNNNNKRKRS